MLIAASGHSEDIDTLSAFAEVREQCEVVLKGKAPQAGLLFAGIDFEHQELLDEIYDAWHGIELIGCTTDGELSSCLGFREDSVSLLLFASHTIDFASGLGSSTENQVLPDDPLYMTSPKANRLENRVARARRRCACSSTFVMVSRP